jgi:hypothetical protein
MKRCLLVVFASLSCSARGFFFSEAPPLRYSGRRAATGAAAGAAAAGPALELTATHGGAPRTVWQLDTNAWLRGDVDLGTGALPASFNIVTSLPDIAELGSRRHGPMRPAAYEAWFVETVRGLLCALPRDKVAIFYQTPGRDTGGTAQPGSSTIG